MSTLSNKIIVNKDDEGVRLDRFLHKKLNIAASLVQKLTRKGQIKLGGRKVKYDTRVSAGDEIEVFADLSDFKSKPTSIISITKEDRLLLKDIIIFEDDYIVAIDKPFDMSVQGGRGVTKPLDKMLLAFYDDHPKLVHRIDKHTTGLVIFAKTDKAARELGKKFKAREIEKTYLAVVVGKILHKEGTIKAPIYDGADKSYVNFDEGKYALTEYKVLENASDVFSVVELYPRTGRKHQLRVHLAYIENPILGDGKYGGKAAFIDGLPNKMHLHAHKLDFDLLGKKYSLEAEVPASYRDLV